MSVTVYPHALGSCANYNLTDFVQSFVQLLFVQRVQSLNPSGGANAYVDSSIVYELNTSLIYQSASVLVNNKVSKFRCSYTFLSNTRTDPEDYMSRDELPPNY